MLMIGDVLSLAVLSSVARKRRAKRFAQDGRLPVTNDSLHEGECIQSGVLGGDDTNGLAYDYFVYIRKLGSFDCAFSTYLPLLVGWEGLWESERRAKTHLDKFCWGGFTN